MPSKDLVFEIGTEEIPAAFVPRALAAIEGLLRKRLEAARLGVEGVKTFGTPRRLAFVVEGLSERQADATVEVRGPQKKAAFDAAGNPTKVLEGFARAQGIAVNEVRIIKTEKGEYVAASRFIKGEAAGDVLPGVLMEVVSSDIFPKSMRWGSHDVSFARPVHWILAVYGGRVVEFEFGHVRSGGVTFGHRFLGAGPVAADSLKGYLEGLRSNRVIADPQERKAVIREGLEKEARAAGGVLLPDEGLLDEVAYLVEWPVVLCGSFDREFLGLPRDVVINAMREHQRYFTVTDGQGALLPCFLTVANTEAKDRSVVVRGNERVLRARLSDAKFYFEKDVKTRLSDKAGLLKGVVFQAKLGTSYEKAERFTGLAVHIGNRIGLCRALDSGQGPSDFLTDNFNPARYDRSRVDPGFYSMCVLGRSAMLSKADLVSGMVGEFPKLQGVMGSVYARRDGEVPEVSVAICEHYLPSVSGGALPASIYGSIVSMADKFDTVAGCFGVGLIPTGAQDPYALRRQALGIIAIVLDKDIRGLDLEDLTDAALDLLKARLLRDRMDVRGDIIEFFKERVRNRLLGQGLSFDSIESVLSAPGSLKDLPDAVKRIRAIEAFKKHPDCPRLVVAFKRVSNILKGVQAREEAPEAALFADPLERALFEAGSKIAPVISGCLEKGDYEKALEVLASIKDTIDAFFDKVMVMCEDEKIRQNRLALLAFVRGLYFRLSDLSRLAV